MVSRGYPDPFRGFATVDMDQIRAVLPEWKSFLQAERDYPDECRGTAAPRTQSEAGYIQEILVDYHLRRGAQMLGDGSLIDADWYAEEFRRLRHAHEEARADEFVYIARQRLEEDGD